MWDRTLRVLKESLLKPFAIMFSDTSPNSITFTAFLMGLICIGAAATGQYWISCIFWGFNRTFDGLDGVIARRFNRSSDLGGYLDILSDFIIYALVPIALVYGHVETLAPQAAFRLWLTLAFLEAAYFVNAGGLFQLAGILEKRRAGATQTKELTTITMPDGFIEGTETVICYTFFIIFPNYMQMSFVIFGIAVCITIIQRAIWAYKHLPSLEAEQSVSTSE